MAYRDEVLADSPVAWWRLGEAAGTNANDETANNLDGTYTGGYTLGQTGALLGDADLAVLLNGSTGYVTIPWNARLNGTADAGSLEAWFKASTAGTNKAIYRQDQAGSAAYGMTFQTTNVLRFYVRDTGSNVLQATVAGVQWLDGAWHHAVGTWRYLAGVLTVSLYVDGVLVASTTGSLRKLQTATAAPQIGRADDSSEYFPGTLDEVAVYDTALPPHRVVAHYTEGRTLGYLDEVRADNPIMVCPLNERSGTTFADIIGKRVGTFAGGVTLAQPGPMPADTTVAASFDGTDDRAAIAVNLSAYSAIALDWWAYWDAFSNNDDLMMEYTSDVNTTNGSFYVNANGSDGRFIIYLRSSGGATFESQGFTRPTAGVWHHYALGLDYNAGSNVDQIALYFDGVRQTPTATYNNNNLPGPFANSTLYLMHRGSNSLFGAGDMAMVGVYPTLLAEARIRAHYAARLIPPRGSRVI